MSPETKPLMVYGRWTVLAAAPNSSRGMRRWACRCSCGTEKIVWQHLLYNGASRSCGCLHREMRYVHGETQRVNGKVVVSPEYEVWHGMLARCTNRNVTGWPRYGRRGISVCDRWRRSFSDFLLDVGRRPSSLHSIDRIRNNGNYEPGNVRWATPREQARNRSNNRLLVVNGETKTMAEWSEVSGIGWTTIRERLSRGWDAPSAILTPVRHGVLGPRM